MRTSIARASIAVLAALAHAVSGALPFESVRTAEQLHSAVAGGVQHIALAAHADLRALPVQDCDDYALPDAALCLRPTTKSIRGFCSGGAPPPSVPSPDLTTVRDGQCVLVSAATNTISLVGGAPEHGSSSLWLDALYVRVVRGDGDTSEKRLVVVKDYGAGTFVWMTDVTLQGDRLEASTGLNVRTGAQVLVQDGVFDSLARDYASIGYTTCGTNSECASAARPTTTAYRRCTFSMSSDPNLDDTTAGINGAVYATGKQAGISLEACRFWGMTGLGLGLARSAHVYSDGAVDNGVWDNIAAKKVHAQALDDAPAWWFLSEDSVLFTSLFTEAVNAAAAAADGHEEPAAGGNSTGMPLEAALPEELQTDSEDDEEGSLSAREMRSRVVGGSIAAGAATLLAAVLLAVFLVRRRQHRSGIVAPVDMEMTEKQLREKQGALPPAEDIL